MGLLNHQATTKPCHDEYTVLICDLHPYDLMPLGWVQYQITSGFYVDTWVFEQIGWVLCTPYQISSLLLSFVQNLLYNKS